MEHSRFATLAAEFETLQRDLQQTNDPALRKAFLIEIRSKLDAIEEMTKSLREEITASN